MILCTAKLIDKCIHPCLHFNKIGVYAWTKARLHWTNVCKFLLFAKDYILAWEIYLEVLRHWIDSCRSHNVIYHRISSAAVKSKARILKPGELTLAIYGADEAVKWERRVMQFIQLTRCNLWHQTYFACKIFISIKREDLHDESCPMDVCFWPDVSWGTLCPRLHLGLTAVQGPWQFSFQTTESADAFN